MRAMLLAAVAAAFVSTQAFAGAAPDVVKQKLEKAYPVKVLRIEDAELDGRPVFAVRVMNMATQNGKFAVTTLLADPETGDLIPAFRHRASGYSVPDVIAGDPHEVNVPERGSTWR